MIEPCYSGNSYLCKYNVRCSNMFGTSSIADLFLPQTRSGRTIRKQGEASGESQRPCIPRGSGRTADSGRRVESGPLLRDRRVQISEHPIWSGGERYCSLGRSCESSCIGGADAMDNDWITPAPRRAAAGRLTRAAAPDGVVCPICGRTISLARIQVHADRCAHQTEPNDTFVAQRRIKAKANAASAPDSREDVHAFGRSHRDRQPQPPNTSAPAAAGKTTARNQAPTRMSKRTGAATAHEAKVPAHERAATLRGSTCSSLRSDGGPPGSGQQQATGDQQASSAASVRISIFLEVRPKSPRAVSGERSRPSMPIQFCSNSTTGAFCRIDRVLTKRAHGRASSVARSHCICHARPLPQTLQPH